MFEHRDNLSAHDALAERLGALLVTCDARLRDAVRRFWLVQLLDLPG